MSSSPPKQSMENPQKQKLQPAGSNRGGHLGYTADGTPRAPHPITGKPLAEKAKMAFDAKKITASLNSFKSFQAIMIEQARLMSWLWGGVAAVGLAAYVFGSGYKKEHAGRSST